MINCSNLEQNKAVNPLYIYINKTQGTFKRCVPSKSAVLKCALNISCKQGHVPHASFVADRATMHRMCDWNSK